MVRRRGFIYRFMRVWLGVEVYAEYLSHGHVSMSSEITDRRFSIRSCLCVRGDVFVWLVVWH